MEKRVDDTRESWPFAFGSDSQHLYSRWLALKQRPQRVKWKQKANLCRLSERRECSVSGLFPRKRHERWKRTSLCRHYVVCMSKVSVDLFFRPHIDASLRRLTLTERDHMNEAKPLPSLFLDNDGEPVSTLCDSDIDESQPGSHPEFFLYLTSVRSHRTSWHCCSILKAITWAVMFPLMLKPFTTSVRLNCSALMEG